MSLKCYITLKDIKNLKKQIIFKENEKVFFDIEGCSGNNIKLSNNGKVIYIPKNNIEKYFDINENNYEE